MELPERKKLPHTPPSWVADAAIYFITICTEPRGQNQLCNEATSLKLFESMELQRERGVWWPHLVLLMPDHLHGLFSFAPDPGLQKAVADWKHFTSRSVGICWQRDFFDHRLRKGESYDEKAAYIRANPVRAGLVERAEDWPYVHAWPTRVSFEG